MPKIAALLLALLAMPPHAPTGELPEALGFLHGCWRGELPGGTLVEEQYSGPEGGVLLGHVKTTGADSLFFEWLKIQVDDEGVWLQPYPRGVQAPVRFQLTELEADKAVFENPAHDFPRRIVYRLLPDERLLTQIAGEIDGKPVLEEYRTRRCF